MLPAATRKLHRPSRLIPLVIGGLVLLAFSGAFAGSLPGATLDAALARLQEGRPAAETGVLVLEKGEESLLARAWLADHAAASIDVQYFIWSTDNIGILAAEALLRAAERGVKVRVLVDDVLIDAPDQSLLALALHPRIEIRIYNPLHSVGTSPPQRLANLVRDFRGFNQRMHNKTLIVDGRVGITGGRNMADEYYDYDQDYNFRDRDILLLGPGVAPMQASFETFWASPLAVPVPELLDRELSRLGPADLDRIYADLRRYASDPENFAPEVRQALTRLPERFADLATALAWTEVRFVSDRPGKNDGSQGLGGGGETTRILAEELRRARRRVIIESPYLILPEGGLELLRDLVARGVEVRICTNSLAATDNLQAFSGYRRQRKALLKAGVEVREFRPDPAILAKLVERYPKLASQAPIFALHAKTMVIDGETLFVGTFNLDPRSANLNTEAGVLVRHRELAAAVEGRIEEDMRPGNSWDPRRDDPDARAPLAKRARLRFWELLPIDALL